MAPIDMVEAFWDSGDDACEECPWFRRAREPHGEWTAECRVLETGKAENCPALDDIKAGRYPKVYDPNE